MLDETRNRLLRFAALVFFILLVGFGAIAYLNYSEQRNLDASQEKFDAVVRDVVEIQDRYRKKQEAMRYEQNRSRTSAMEDKGEQANFMEAADIGEFRKLFLPAYENISDSDTVSDNGIWLQSELARHRAAVEDKNYDLVVLPIQQSGSYFDRVVRFMPARWVANELKFQTQRKVMSPELLLRLLGDRSATFSDSQIKGLAEQVGANVIHMYLGSETQWPIHGLKLAVVETNAQGLVQKRVIRSIEQPTDAHPLELVIKEHVQSIVAELYGVKSQRKLKDEEGVAPDFKLPTRIDGLADAHAGAVTKAARLQLIAMLTPHQFEYERRRLFERSLLAIDKARPGGEYSDLIKARAFFYLSRRPVAMTLVGSAELPAEKALVEFLNGNYPELASISPQIEEPLFKVISLIELRSLGYKYEKSNRGEIPDLSQEAYWKHLIASAMRDGDIWYAPVNAEFFAKLHGLFPDFDKKLSEVVGGKLVSGSVTGQMVFEKSIETVFEESLRREELENCCATYEGYPEKSDIWQLYRNLSIANKLRKLDRSVNVHASYNRAAKYAEKLTPLLEGNPTFTRLYAQAIFGLAQKSDGSEKEYLQQKAYKLATKVTRQSSAVDADTISAGYLMNKLEPFIDEQLREAQGKSFNALYNAWVDFPTVLEKMPLYMPRPESLAYTNTSFRTFEVTAKVRNWDYERISKELNGRFNGHPSKSVYLANRSIDEGDNEKAAEILESAIANGEDAWTVYSTLGSVLINSGQYKASKDAFLKYPYFKDYGDKDRVGVSNDAYEAGSRLFWLGLHEEAKPLYEIASGLQTGAASQYASRQRLAMLERDFKAAITYAYKRGQRYNSIYGYRDYLAFLHLVGAHQQAVAGFNALVPRYRTPELWTSQFIGQRMESYGFEQCVGWVHELIQGSDNAVLKHYGQSYLLKQSLIDRTIEPEHLKPVINLSDRAFFQGREVFAESDVRAVFTPEVMETLVAPCTNGEKDCDSAAAAADYSSADFAPAFMDAYQDLFNGHYKSAFRKFIEFDKYYPSLREDPMHKKATGSALPYLVMAATKVAPKEYLQRIFERLADDRIVDDSEYEMALSEAIILSALKRNDAALAALQRAFDHRPHTQSRPIYTWYEITSIAEWLSQQSDDRRFIDLALTWAKRYQAIQPQFAWAYAFEALYAQEEGDRIRAAGFADYLDPKSAWLSKVPDSIRKKGVELWPKLNPFIIKQETESQATAEI